VFLSYASQDSEAARRICEALRAARIEVWFDQSELRGGDVWDRQIRKQIHDCALFIPLISQHSQERLEGYFRLEWKLAVDRSHRMAAERSFIVPVVVDSTRERDALVPDSFRDVQWTHLPGGEASQAFVARVAALLGAPAPVATANKLGPEPAAGPKSQTRQSRTLVIALGLLTLAIATGGAWLIWRGVGTRTPAMQGSSSGVTAATERSIAVLPFLDMSEKRDQEYFADGIAEELLDMLAQIPGLRVIGRTSSFQFKGKNEDLRMVGRALGVAHVVEGSVRRYGDQVRITAQLVRAADGAHEWSGTYDRNVQNVLQVQKELATSLARALEISISSSSLAAGSLTPATGSTSAEAYDLYLRGRHAEDPETRQALTDAEAYFQRALEIDPNFIAAREALAVLHLVQATNAFVIGDNGYPRVKKEANELLAQNPNSLIGHALLCRYNLAYSWNWSEAKHECDIALHIDPRSLTATYQAAELALALGHPARAEQLYRAILSLDPLDGDTHVELSDTLLRQGRFADAETEARKALAVAPSMYYGHFLLGESLLAQGRPQEALQSFQNESPEGGQQAGIAMAFHALGRDMEAASALRRFAENNGAGNSFVLAEANAYMGNTDRALEWLETALRGHEPGLQYVNVDWLLEPLESDPRFKAFLHKMNLPE
jgi:TolB-like protein/Tfp pilus assembly protein PilF